MSSYNTNLNGKNKLIPKIITRSQSQNDIYNTNNQTKPIKMVRSYTFNDILKNDLNWSEDIKKYDFNKKNLQWGFNPRPKIIKAQNIKLNDLYFNPITQKYKDKEYDKELKKQEEKELKDKISLYYDKELRVMQTYDIINLKDRLKGFENHPDYPKIKKSNVSVFKKVNNFPKKNYNILSNISLSQHHYDKPENRPIDKYVKNNIGNNMNKINLKHYKDYNIISNKYKEYDKEKKEIDTKLIKIEASKEFYKTKDYDIIKGVFVDSEKERKYQDEIKNKVEKLKNIKRDTVFNPFNNEIYDKERFDEENKKLANKIYRYSLKPEIDNYYYQQGLSKDISKNNTLKSKLIYQRFKYIDKRGYDCITGKDKYNQYKNSLSFRSIQKPWEMIKNGVNSNETLSNKKLYLCYDKDDTDQKFNECKINREKMLKDLQKIECEDIFKLKEYPHKINLNPIKNNNLEYNNRYGEQRCDSKSFSMDKSVWFSQNRNNNYSNN